MNNLIQSSILILVLFSGCKNIPEKPTSDNKDRSEADSVYHFSNADLTAFFYRYPKANKDKLLITKFYQKRNYESAWLTKSGVNEYARNFINLLHHEPVYTKNDSALYLDTLHALYDLVSRPYYLVRSKDKHLLTLELLLTVNFFDYARRNWGAANDTILKKANWLIKRKELNYEELLDTLLMTKDYFIFIKAPVYRQYGLLKNYLQRYKEIEKSGGWPLINADVVTLFKGDSSPLLKSAKKYLSLTGDLIATDSSTSFNDLLESALKKYQNRLGLPINGLLTEQTVNAMNVTVRDRIQHVIINMERSRWVPIEIKGDYLAVNIPEFKLHVYTNDSLKWSCNVVVGKENAVNNTVIFNDSLEYIVFSPYWNVPETILTNEILPAIKNNLNYLSAHNLEVVNFTGEYISPTSVAWQRYTTNFPYMIREKPGKNNSLGLAKFLLPNAYDIYLHDTPAKSLFGESKRAFSHGCVRIEDPFKLAQFLLRKDSTYSVEKIKELMNGNKQTFVKLKNKTPVFIVYFTAWVDREGKLNFREDVYKHDEKMRDLLFK